MPLRRKFPARTTVTASPLKQHGVETSPPARQPSSPASRNDHTSSISVRSWPCRGLVLKTIFPTLIHSILRVEAAPVGRLDLLARARPGQGIISAAVRKTLVLRALQTERAGGLSPSARRFCSLSFSPALPCPALPFLQSSCSSSRANGQAPLNGFGQQTHLAPALNAISRGFVAPAAGTKTMTARPSPLMQPS
jgi:hypothetical protein